MKVLSSPDVLAVVPPEPAAPAVAPTEALVLNHACKEPHLRAVEASPVTAAWLDKRIFSISRLSSADALLN